MVHRRARNRWASAVESRGREGSRSYRGDWRTRDKVRRRHRAERTRPGRGPDPGSRGRTCVERIATARPPAPVPRSTTNCHGTRRGGTLPEEGNDAGLDHLLRSLKLSSPGRQSGGQNHGSAARRTRAHQGRQRHLRCHRRRQAGLLEARGRPLPDRARGSRAAWRWIRREQRLSIEKGDQE